MTLPPRAVVVHRRTELDELLQRHGTRGAAEFFLRTRGRSLETVQRQHDLVTDALAQTAAAIPPEWRRGLVERADLDRFLFEPEDIVVIVGQDGLVANVAKSLAGQPVVGVNPEPERNPGVLVPIAVREVSGALHAAAAGTVGGLEERVMVRASVDDGQTINALNEIYIGQLTQQSARYRLTAPGQEPERQSSSGIIVSTGTGASGWCRSIARERHTSLRLPAANEAGLVWFVREAWPSPATGADLTEGGLDHGEALVVVAESDGLVVFGDGIESDRVVLSWGQQVSVALAPEVLRLVRPPGAVPG